MKTKLLISFLVLIVSINNISAQCIRVPKIDERKCCLAITTLPVTIASYRLSLLYGYAENEQLGNGNIYGGELTWFPVQTLTEERRQLVYGIKIIFNNTGSYGPNTPYLSAFIETDLYLRKIRNDSIHVFDPYIGFDLGITDGFLQDRHSNFAIGPIIGCAFNISDFFAIYFSGKYSFIYEDPRSKMLQFSLGIQFNTFSLIF